MTSPETPGPAAGPTTVTVEKWSEVRSVLRSTGERFAALILDAPDPGTMATADWTVADTAAHVTAIAWQYTAMAAAEEVPLPIPLSAEAILGTTVDNLHGGLNTDLFELYDERDPEELARRLRSSIEEVLAHTADADPERLIGWLGGSLLPLAGLLAHLVDELLVHGLDIARALGRPWRIAPEEAALFFELFVVEIMRNPGGILDTGKPPRAGRIAVEFRSRYTHPVTVVLEDGRVSVAEPSGNVDVRVRFAPDTLVLMLFHRIGKPRAALTGGVRISGRRPWLLPAFLRTVRLP